MRSHVFLLIAFLVPAVLQAQDARGTVLGRVLDASGGAVPAAEVRIVNDNTGVPVAAKTNAVGNYVIPYLLPGNYTISCEVAGFKKYVRGGIQVRITDRVEVNIELQVGAAQETIEVTATTPLLSTADASLGQVVDEQRILDLPLFAGNALDLVHLAPGTVNGTDLRLRKAGFNNAPSQFSTDGGDNYGNEFSIDGVSNTYSNGTQPRVAFSPPATAITEFKVQTSAYDASLGHTSGSTVNVSIKSGTNTFHGEAHEWLRHSKLDCPTIFDNRSGLELPIYQDNRYGFSLGAPVTIPSVYDGKNRSFWFFSYEGNKFGSSQTFTSTVPTAKMRTGDLSEWRAKGSAYQIYDPYSTTYQGGIYVRQPVSNNVIPSSQLSQVGLNMLALYPMPNQTGTSDYQSNYYRNGKALEDYWVWLVRFDHSFSENHRMFVRLHRDWWEEDKSRTWNNDVNGIILHRNNKGIAFDDVYVFSPTTLVNFRYGLTYQDFPEERVSRGYDLSKLGLSSQLLSQIPLGSELRTLPYINVSPYTTLSSWESGDGVTASTTHSFVANFTKLKGNHNLRFGTELRIYREANNRFHRSTSPQYTFAATYTKQSSTSSNPTLGGHVASLLYGIPGGAMSVSDSYMEQDKYWAAYLQDDWKIGRKLTVTLGLRYELETPITERFDRAVTQFAFDTANPLNDAARAKYALNPIPELAASDFRAYGGLTFANAGGNPRTYWEGEKNNFQPRIGLAYELAPKTILRAGYGIFVASIGTNYTNTNLSGFSQETPITASEDNGLTYIATTANPFPSGLTQPAGASGGLSTYLGQNISYFSKHRKHPYAQRWSFGLQRELPFKMMAEASYVGNRSTRASIDRNINYTPAKYLSTSPTRDQTTIDYLGATFPNPYYCLNSIYTKTMSRSNLLKPYSHFGDITMTGDEAGYSWYHSLQTRLERRMAEGWTLQIAYTWSKAMEATEFLNASDPMPSEVISDMDRTHRIAGSGIWQIPYGRKRKWGSQSPAALNFIFGGWQLGGVYQHQSGQALGFGNVIFNGDLDNIVLPEGQRGVDGWFNVNAGFERSSSKQLGSNIRTMPLRFCGVRGPNQDRWDLTMIKNFRVTERLNTEFRAETFNALNHPNLGNPTTTVTSSTFGRITSQGPTRSWQFALKLTW
ncbi:MAG: TonB-dependent receptor [Bryobacteraceae bacterium]